MLAFIVWHKNRRESGVIHANERMYLVAAEMGISPNTYASFKKRCIDRGLLKPMGEKLQFVSLRAVIVALFKGKNFTETEVLKEWKYRKFWRFAPNNPKTYKEFFDTIVFSAAELNFVRQNYRQKEKVSTTRERFKNNLNTVPRRSENLNLGIITGKHHISSLVGCCSSTATKLLKRWSKDKRIIRKIQKETYFFALDNSPKDLNLIPAHAFWINGKWVATLGSQITLYPESLSFIYNKEKCTGRIINKKEHYKRSRVLN